MYHKPGYWFNFGGALHDDSEVSEEVLLAGIFTGRNVAVVTLLKVIAPWGTQKGSHGVLQVDFNLLFSREQNLMISWAGQCQYGAGTEAVRAPRQGAHAEGRVSSVLSAGWVCLRKQQMVSFNPSLTHCSYFHGGPPRQDSSSSLRPELEATGPSAQS